MASSERFLDSLTEDSESFDSNTNVVRFSMGERVFLQLHKFNDVYTLFWTSVPEDNDLISETPNVLEEVIINSRISYLSQPVAISLGIVSLLRENKRGRGLVEDRRYYKVNAFRQAGFVNRVSDFLDSRLRDSVSLNITLSPDPSMLYRPHLFSLWTGTKRVPDQETGITARYGLYFPRRSIVGLMAKTSPVLRDKADLDIGEFLGQMVKKHKLISPK